MRVVFAGTPAFSLPALTALLDAFEVELAAVFTRPDRPAGRGRLPQQSAVKQLATVRDIPVFQPRTWNDDAVAGLAQLQPDLMVVVAYGEILPLAALATPALGCVNLHASLLPRWRGAAPVERAIEAGDEVTGITLMQMSEGLDTGAVLAQSVVPVAADDTGGSLRGKLAHRAAELLTANLPALAAHALPATPQDETRATYARKLRKADGRLNWQHPAAVLARQVRAFNPWPVAFGEVNGMRLRILQSAVDAVDSSPSATKPGETGKIIAADKTGIRVSTGDGVLVLLTVQKPGGKQMSAAALLNGMDIQPGMHFVTGGGE